MHVPKTYIKELSNCVSIYTFCIVPLSGAEVAEKLPLLLGTLLAVVIGELIAANSEKKHQRAAKAED